MQLKPEEISKIIRAQIKHYENVIEQSEVGTVIMVGDGIARASGLEKCMAGELLQFENGEYGMPRTSRRIPSPSFCWAPTSASRKAAPSSAPARSFPCRWATH